MRYKIYEGNLDYKPQARDDFMGLAFFAEGPCFEESPPPPVPEAPPDAASTQQAAELDAFAKGKGKGKGKGDGRCQVCNGEDLSPETARQGRRLVHRTSSVSAAMAAGIIDRSAHCKLPPQGTEGRRRKGGR